MAARPGGAAAPAPRALDLLARGRRARYEVAYLGLQGLPTRLFPPRFLVRRVGGRDALPRGGVLLCPNHESYLDPALVQLALPRRRLTFVMTNAFYGAPFARAFFRLVGAIPVAPGRLAWESVRRAAALLRMGRAVVVFPEGRLSRTGEMGPAQRGVAVLARAGHAPVLPVAIAGSRRAWPRGARWLHRADVRVVVGEPMRFDGPPGRDSEQAFADAILARVSQLRMGLDRRARQRTR